jgi:hypothetical protein
MKLREVDVRHELDEDLRVVLWRTATLAEAGYDEESAIDLALSDVDLHLATTLLKRGCPVDTAMRILL